MFKDKIKVIVWKEDIQVCEGKVYPWYIGRAYYNPWKMSYCLAVIPLNWIIGTSRKLWVIIKSGLPPTKKDRSLFRRVYNIYKAGQAKVWENIENGTLSDEETQKLIDYRVDSYMKAVHKELEKKR